MALTIREQWLAKNLADRRLASRPRRAPATPQIPPATALRKARAGKAADVKGPRKRLAADVKAAAGALPQWTTAEIEEAFRRFRAASPEPKGELEHVNPFTLLVAVVLSAQATDAGVNKATPALFAAADTPAKMAALGEARVQELIKTIGLFRTKAKNVVALSQQARRGARQRGAALARGAGGAARRRPQDRQRGPQHGVRRADHRGRHPYLPGRQPHRPGDRARPRSRSR